MKAFILFLITLGVAFPCFSQQLEQDRLIKELRQRLDSSWRMESSGDTLYIESRRESRIDFYNSAGAPVNDPELKKFTPEYLQEHGRKTRMRISFLAEPRWDSLKTAKVIAENKQIAASADSLLFKYRLDHSHVTRRYTEELIWAATPEEEKRFEAYKKEKALILQGLKKLPEYNTEHYSLFILDRNWLIGELYYMRPMIWPESEEKKVRELERVLEELLKP